VRDSKQLATLTNQIANPYYVKQAMGGTLPTIDWKQQVLELAQAPCLPKEDHAMVVTLASDPLDKIEPDDRWTKIPAKALNIRVATPNQQMDPFNPERIQAILKAVTVGENLTSEEHRKVCDLIGAHADCFTLSVHEVIPAKDAKLHLEVPDDTPLPTKTCQQTFTPPQRHYLHKKIFKMLEVGIIEQTDPAKIKCISPTTLGQKQHDGTGLTLEEL
jgi:hypothetical protein